ncbi:unnamed protein product, partial [Ectocarpus fasciculatus]
PSASWCLAGEEWTTTTSGQTTSSPTCRTCGRCTSPTRASGGTRLSHTGKSVRPLDGRPATAWRTVP